MYSIEAQLIYTHLFSIQPPLYVASQEMCGCSLRRDAPQGQEPSQFGIFLPKACFWLFVLFLFLLTLSCFSTLLLNIVIEICSTYHPVHPLKVVYISVYLIIFGGLCNPYHHLILDFFCYPQRNLPPISSHPLFPPPLFQPRKQVICFLCFMMHEIARNLSPQDLISSGNSLTMYLVYTYNLFTVIIPSKDTICKIDSQWEFAV